MAASRKLQSPTSFFRVTLAARRLQLSQPRFIAPPVRSGPVASVADPTIEIGESELQLYGPFKHGVNNFKIDKVVSESRLISDKHDYTWAIRGDLDSVIPSKLHRPTIEFYTLDPPVGENPSWVQFRNPQELIISRKMEIGKEIEVVNDIFGSH